MKISASNIGWKKEYDNRMYEHLSEMGVSGLEIAPTRIFATNPYDCLKEAEGWARSLKSDFGLVISSMQSIWYGRNENIFASKQERETLSEYTKKAIDFASAIGCGNLVFGCPRNRSFSEGADISVAEVFFGELGDYAFSHGTVLAMEANPPMYNTNYCNRTTEAIELIKRVNSKGFLLNLDVGTMVANEESVGVLSDAPMLINHVHISEPGLMPIEQRTLHGELAEFLSKNGYNRFVSLEIKAQEDTEVPLCNISYLQTIFGQW